MKSIGCRINRGLSTIVLYRNVYRGDSLDTIEDTARQQICMFNNGYAKKNGDKGICYQYKDWQTLPACVEYRNSH